MHVYFLTLECVHSEQGLIYASSTVCTCPSVGWPTQSDTVCECACMFVCVCVCVKAQPRFWFSLAALI